MYNNQYLPLYTGDIDGAQSRPRLAKQRQQPNFNEM